VRKLTNNKKMKTINYTNKAGQSINVEYAHKYFGNGMILKGEKTLVNGFINKTQIPPFYIDGHASDDEVKKSISDMRKNRKNLKNA
jgi:hypothetical protein